MRLPFFSSTKADSKQTTDTAATPPVAETSAPQAEFHRPAGRTTSVHPAEMSETRPLFQRSQSNGGSTIDIPVTAFLSQLPAQLFAPNAHSQLALVTVAISQERVLPQLKTGKVTVMLEEIIPLLPAQLLRQPVSSSIGQQTISLPLGDVVAAVPSSAFAVEHASTLDLNSPEFSNLPPLFDESLLQEPVVAAEVPVAEPEQTFEPAAEVVEEPVAAAEPPPAPIVEPAAPVAAPKSEPAPAPTIARTPVPVPSPAPIAPKPQPAPKVAIPTDDLPARVMVSLRGLVAGMPDKVFATTRTDLWRVADPEARVAIPFEPIQSQLQGARVRLPLETVIAAMPSELFTSPLPPLSGETVPIPLDEIIPQLSPRVFSILFRQPQTETVDISASIPTPFHERNEVAAEPEPVVDQVAAQAVEPVTHTPVAPAAPEPVKQVVSADQLDDEAFAIFAEKTPPPPAVPEETIPTYVIEESAAAAPQPEPEVQPEPNIEAKPEPTLEPVAETVEEADEEEVEPLAAVLPAEEPMPATIPEHVVAEDRKFLVNLNRCTAEELVRIQGIGPALARRIVAAREQRGQFRSVRELRQLPGIGPKTYRALVGTEPRVLNRLLGVQHDQELSLQEVVKHISAMEGVAGAILAMSDGLLLTGQLPANLDSNAVSVFAPQLFKKVGRYTRELRVGQIRRLTIFTDQQPVSIFQAGDIYLVIVHDAQRYSKALLRRCERVSQEIAALCRQRAVV